MSDIQQDKGDSTAQRLNKLRAAVLGANDGIVSVAATVIGVAAALPHDLMAIATAGFAALSAGAFSMAAGEYVSVSTQRDTEEAVVSKVRSGLSSESIRQMADLAQDLEDRGVSQQIAERAAAEMYAHDPVHAVSKLENIDPEDLVSPWAAAVASFIAFTIGAALPVAAILIFPAGIRIPATFAAVILALILTGFLSAKAGGADAGRATIRTVIGGSIGMAFTYGIGLLLNTQAL